ncbi:hypothetical protein EJ05DRAFT_138689 [Pseudovirgaria hyperparasitica]|uniref:NADH dehydrogenase [ubiquinone] iron-sulfur protein 4, mitochondrial n=1 Tax=Pseudovirgaria hyperparasitica TaxID=470096 RepID=A0A6A6VYH1_9PEZI|nr:uncharacterized protein EJ05DRAFT_138689 [Pseudovirgaria hyperparasitica]KAF2754347.1 hypothetical protein EJ05DRAFT_138689 [Pseudovirgaria hyperparasitica]
MSAWAHIIITMQRTLCSRLIAAATKPAVRSTNARFYSKPNNPDAPGKYKTTQEDAMSVAGIENPERAVDQLPTHPLNYDVAPDYRTSQFSPLPKRVMDGSEPTGSIPAAVLSGAPIDLQARTVRIYRPTKPATQSGDWHSHHWLMDWDPLPKGHRWENPLMGWQSSADCMQGHRIQFKSKEDAIDFANKQGYEYFVQEPNERKFVPKAYATQFIYSPKKLKTVRTK